MTASCSLCGETWPRDPRTEVECPTCGAKPGTRCKRPSGHTTGTPHVDRELLAIREGHLSRECPGAHGPSPDEAYHDLQRELFA